MRAIPLFALVAAELFAGACVLATSLDDLTSGAVGGRGGVPSTTQEATGSATGGGGMGGVGGAQAVDAGCDCKSVFQACVGGTCVCAAPMTPCDATCVDTDVDPLHCGACDHACKGGELCVDGACVCPPNADLCGGQCRTKGSQLNCSKSNMPCGSCCPGCIQGEYICIDDACAPPGPCPSPTTQCGQTNSYACVDTSNDPHNCGACDHACAPGELCVASGCVPFEPAPFCDSCNACGAQCGELLGGQSYRCCTTTPAGDFPVCVAGADCP